MGESPHTAGHGRWSILVLSSTHCRRGHLRLHGGCRHQCSWLLTRYLLRICAHRDKEKCTAYYCQIILVFRVYTHRHYLHGRSKGRGRGHRHSRRIATHSHLQKTRIFSIFVYMCVIVTCTRAINITLVRHITFFTYKVRHTCPPYGAGAPLGGPDP